MKNGVSDEGLRVFRIVVLDERNGINGVIFGLSGRAAGKKSAFVASNKAE